MSHCECYEKYEPIITEPEVSFSLDFVARIEKAFLDPDIRNWRYVEDTKGNTGIRVDMVDVSRVKSEGLLSITYQQIRKQRVSNNGRIITPLNEWESFGPIVTLTDAKLDSTQTEWLKVSF